MRNTRIPYMFTPKRMKTSSSHEWKKNELKDGTSEAEAVQTCQTLNVPFSKAIRGVFFQDKPCLNNVYDEDSSLRDYLQRLVPTKTLTQITPDLQRFGNRISNEIDELGRQCELNPPTIETLDAWGNRIDKLRTCTAWKQQKVISAQEGIIAIPYEQEYGPFSRVYSAAKMLMYSPSSGLYSCPLAMTDGAAKFFQTEGDKYPSIKKKAFGHLTSRDGNQFWTSGQWMTERRGGSDVANGTETVAVRQKDGSFQLFGYKWFSSATDADMTLTLARIVDKDGNSIQGTKGISLFYVETMNEDGHLNGMEIHRLKNKLGTRQLPTAELLLDGTIAHLVSDEGRGIAAISSMLTISRYHNSLSAVGLMRRMVHLARDYSQRRYAFGKMISNHPLHMQTLARMEVETRGNLILMLHLSYLLGLEECGMATEHQQHLLRLLTPIAKLYTAKQAIAIASEGLECFGGQGYIEDTGLPVMLRDAQVLSIWEGTTNILSLDVLRSIAKTSGGTLSSFFTDIQTRLIPLAQSDNLDIRDCCQRINVACSKMLSFVKSSSNDQALMEVASRDFAYSLARTYIASLLLEHAVCDKAKQYDLAIANRWCQQSLCYVHNGCHEYTKEGVDHDRAIVMDGYKENIL